MSENSRLNFNISTFAMMTSIQQAGDDHHIRDQDAHPHPSLETVETMGGTTSQLNGAFHHANAAFDAIAEVQALLEPVLLLIGSALWRGSSGVREDDLLDAEAACQVFIV